ncbi:hypothetical protein HY624_02140 [Candidatus Uhrbacteria bacterium]|nr:hypothetical protein [Candidatus Uhrbacteria bacterium]
MEQGRRGWVIGTVWVVGFLAAFSVISIVVLVSGIRWRTSVDQQLAQTGSTAMGANTENVQLPVEEPVIKESGVAEQREEQRAEEPAAPPAWQPNATLRIRENKRIVEQCIRRHEELRTRIEQAYAALGGYRDGVRFTNETAESRAVLQWGGRLASQTALMRVAIDDSIEDLRALAAHEEYQQSRLSYHGTLVLDPVRTIDPERLPRNVQIVYEWFSRYAKALGDVEREWREGLNPTYTALSNMLEAEAERARNRRDDVLRSPPDGGSSASVGAEAPPGEAGSGSAGK